MQLYGRGLRRRLPTMLDGDQRRMRMVYSLAFSLPGTPVLFYGEEIGMAENLAIEGRYSVRAPMQWSDEPQGGFTTARGSRSSPGRGRGRFGPAEVNVARQRRDAGLTPELDGAPDPPPARVPELGWGDCELLDPGDPAVLAHRWTGVAARSSRCTRSLMNRGKCAWPWVRQRRQSTCSTTTSCGRRVARSRYHSARTAIAGSGYATPVSA